MTSKIFVSDKLVACVFVGLVVGLLSAVVIPVNAEESTTIFEEDFNSGIGPSKWISWGSPSPIIVTGVGQDGSDALDCNGDSFYPSGITSLQNFKLSDYPTVEFWAKGYQSLTWHQCIIVGISVYPSDNWGGSWDETKHDDLIYFIHIASNTGDASQPRDCIYYIGPGGSYQEDYPDNDWHHYKMVVNTDGTVSFYRDNIHKYTTPGAIDFDIYDNRPLQISGRSLGAHQLVDDVKVMVGAEVPLLTPSGLIALVGLLSAIAAVAIVRKRR